MFKRFILTAALASVLAAPALARVEVRQNADGTADYVGSRGDTKMCLGGVVLPVTVNMNSASSGVTVSPITNAVLRDIRTGRMGTTTGTNVLRFFFNQTLVARYSTPLQFVGRMPNTDVTNVFINQTNGGISKTEVISTFGEVSGAVGFGLNTLTNNNNTIQAGDALMVGSSGGATGNVSTTVFFHLCPR